MKRFGWIPKAVGQTVAVGVEVVSAHTGDPLVAREIGTVLGYMAETAVETLAAKPSLKPGRHLLHIARVPQEGVSPAWFVYALGIEGSTPNAVIAAAPRLFLSEAAAGLYAERLAQIESGLKERPLLILSTDPGSAPLPGADAPDDWTWQAWDLWCEERLHRSESAIADVPFGPTVLGDIPGIGIIVWQPVLTALGGRIGTLGARGITLDDPPTVFPSERAARKAVDEGHEAESIPHLLYTPMSLLRELDTGLTGSLERLKPRPAFWLGDPLDVRPVRRESPVKAANIHPEVYVSTDSSGSSFAWKPIGTAQVRFMRTRYPDGNSGIARWRSQEQCLQDLGRLGILAQAHTSLTITPDNAVSMLGPRVRPG